MRLPHSAKRPAQLLVLACMSYFVFWACAPMMSAPPATPMTDPSRSELGVAAHGGGGFDVEQTEEDLRDGDGLDSPAVLGGGTIWLRRAAGKNRQNQRGMFLHATVLQEQSCPEYCEDIAWGIGGFYRWTLSQSETFYSGVQLSGGYPFVTLGVPLAFSVGDDMWLTTQPRLGVGFASMVHLPVGLSLPVGKHGRVDAELGVHLEPEAMGSLGAPLANMRDEIYDGFSHYQYMPYIGVGYAMPLGAKK